ncbi:hypothetical protein ACOME3_006493 [Neoechinorhynchus agilis]
MFDKIVAVMSGKGGVGKSTISVGLSLALSHSGYRIGLLDADVYGCSIPRLLSVSQKDLIETIQVNSLPVALVKNTNIQCASLRLLSSKDSPLAWRGLIATKALNQLIFQSEWQRPLDYLVVDCPPGTGDVILTLKERLSITDLLLVATPYAAAQEQVLNSSRLFDQNKPRRHWILNMAENVCGHCGSINQFSCSNMDVVLRFPISHYVAELFDRGRAQDVFGGCMQGETDLQRKERYLMKEKFVQLAKLI